MSSCYTGQESSEVELVRRRVDEDAVVAVVEVFQIVGHVVDVVVALVVRHLTRTHTHTHTTIAVLAYIADVAWLAAWRSG